MQCPPHSLAQGMDTAVRSEQGINVGARLSTHRSSVSNY